jgi:hypothetical protein
MAQTGATKRWLTDCPARTQHLIQVPDKMEIRWRYLPSQETGRATMNKNISIVVTAIAALCIGMHPASASLLGMPMNLKVAIELREAAASVPACQFYTGDVLTGPLLLELLTSSSHGD